MERTDARALAASFGSLQILFEIAMKENALETLMTLASFARRTAQVFLQFLERDRTLRVLKALAEMVTLSAIVDEADVGERRAIVVAGQAERNFVVTGEIVNLGRFEVMNKRRKSQRFIMGPVMRKKDYVVYALDQCQTPLKV